MLFLSDFCLREETMKYTHTQNRFESKCGQMEVHEIHALNEDKYLFLSYFLYSNWEILLCHIVQQNLPQ